MSRRGRVGAVASARRRTSGGGGAPPGPTGGGSLALAPWVGYTESAAAPTVLVSAKTDAASRQARLVVADTVDLATNTTYGPVATANGNARVKLATPSLAPDHLYYYGIDVGGAIDAKRGEFRTFANGRANFTFAFASCNNSTDSACYSHIWNASPKPLLNVCVGDLGYWDITTNDQAAFRSGLDAKWGAANQGFLMARMPFLWKSSDHDFGPNNSTSSSASNPAFNAVYRECCPHPPLLSGTSTGIYSTFACNGARFILSDDRSFKVTNSTVWGSTQETALRSVITSNPEPLIFLMGDMPWVAPAAAGSDDWGEVSSGQRASLATFFEQQRALGKHVVYCSGDMHGLAYDNGSNAPGGIVCCTASPLNNTNSTKGGPYSGGTNTSSTQQHGRISVSWAASEVTITFEGFNSTGARHFGPFTSTFPI